MKSLLVLITFILSFAAFGFERMDAQKAVIGGLLNYNVSEACYTVYVYSNSENFEIHKIQDGLNGDVSNISAVLMRIDNQRGGYQLDLSLENMTSVSREEFLTVTYKDKLVETEVMINDRGDIVSLVSQYYDGSFYLDCDPRLFK